MAREKAAEKIAKTMRAFDKFNAFGSANKFF